MQKNLLLNGMQSILTMISMLFLLIFLGCQQKIADQENQEINKLSDQEVIDELTMLGIQIKKDSKLGTLEISSNSVTNENLKLFKMLPKLKRIDLQGSPITDEGLLHLHGLEQLHEINLQGTNVTEEGVKALQKSLSDTIIRA